MGRAYLPTAFTMSHIATAFHFWSRTASSAVSPKDSTVDAIENTITRSILHFRFVADPIAGQAPVQKHQRTQLLSLTFKFTRVPLPVPEEFLEYAS
jgi:hypothetical protein